MTDSKQRLKTLAELRELQDALDKDIRVVEATTVEHTNQLRAAHAELRRRAEYAESLADDIAIHAKRLEDIIAARTTYAEDNYQKKRWVVDFILAVVVTGIVGYLLSPLFR